MKKIITICAAILMTISVFAQAPNKMSYQAVIRNNSNTLVVSQTVGMRISILQTSPNGTAVYVETQTPTTNANGLVSIEIGGGTIVTGNFSSIDWANGPYFIQTETDPTGGTSYTITRTSQLLSVPYALHAKRADSITGGITENDPVFGASVASGITGADTTYWNNKQNTLNAGSNITIAGDTISATSNGIFTHYIGEAFGGGVIFHLWKDNLGVEHGLIVDITDLSSSQVWSNIDQTLIGPSAQSSWDGLSNSNAIIGQTGHTNSAAALCLNSSNGGQSDWYLPSIDELQLLYTHRFNVNKSFSSIVGASALSTSNIAYYWSSTETGSYIAWGVYFLDGSASNAFFKNDAYYVRAVRAF